MSTLRHIETGWPTGRLVDEMAARVKSYLNYTSTTNGTNASSGIASIVDNGVGITYAYQIVPFLGGGAQAALTAPRTPGYVVSSGNLTATGSVINERRVLAETAADDTIYVGFVGPWA